VVSFPPVSPLRLYTPHSFLNHSFLVHTLPGCLPNTRFNIIVLCTIRFPKDILTPQSWCTSSTLQACRIARQLHRPWFQRRSNTVSGQSERLHCLCHAMYYIAGIVEEWFWAPLGAWLHICVLLCRSLKVKTLQGIIPCRQILTKCLQTKIENRGKRRRCTILACGATKKDKIIKAYKLWTETNGRPVQGVGLWPLACWDGEFESRRSVFCILCWQAGVYIRRVDHSSSGVLSSIMCLSLVVKPLSRGGLGPLGAVEPWGQKL